MGLRTGLLIFVLLGLLLFGIYFAVSGWNIAGDDVRTADVRTAEVSGHGYVAMALGIVATLALGIGLMALLFASNRHDR